MATGRKTLDVTAFVGGAGKKRLMPNAELDPHHPSRISRRALLRSAVLGGSGLLAAHLLNCGDGDGDATLTATSAPPTEAPPTEPPSPTPTPQVLRWEPFGVGERPPPRRDHALFTDGERLFLFAGRSGSDLADLWFYDLKADAWSLVDTEGPPARHGHNAIWDVATERLVVFGGQQSNTFFNDTWAFDLAGELWSELQTNTAPAPRYGAGGALDPAGGRMLVTHGFTNSGRFDDTWQFDLGTDTWTDISPAGPRPVERCLMRAAWDPGKQRLLMFGGQTTGTPFLGDLWALTEGGWTEITTDDGPSPRNFYSFVFDDAAGRAILFGGDSADGPTNDLWFFDAANDTWSKATPENEGPSPRFGHDAVWLPDRRSLIAFGGNDGTADLNDLWALSVPT